MMNTPAFASALTSLPPEWQKWVNENVTRSCTPESMAAVMIRDGHFDARLAHAAIEEAQRFNGIAPVQQPQAMPAIDSSTNTIATGDRAVHVLMSLHRPRVVLIGNLLSDDECDELIAYSERRLERSPVVSDTDGKTQLHAHRTSRGAMMQRGETELITRIETRLAVLTNWPADRGEGLQVLRYDKENEYRPHYDWFDAASPGPRKHLERGGQRLATIVMYLSDVEQGGGTSFPNIGLQIQPRKGSAVFFTNTDQFHAPDNQTLHAGEPVVSGVKYVATKWLRQRTYA